MNAAISAYEAYLREEPDDAAVTLRLARVLDDAGRVRDALAATHRSLSLRPSHAQAEVFQKKLEDDLAEGPERLDADSSSSRPLSIEAFSSWRRQPTPLPPNSDPTERSFSVLAFVETGGGTSVALDRTLDSLSNQGVDYEVRVIDSPASSLVADMVADSGRDFVLHIRSGVVLAQGAMDWLAYGAMREGAIGAVADHEVVGGTPDAESSSESFTLHGQPSWLDLQSPSSRYPFILLSRAALLLGMRKTPELPLSDCIDTLFSGEAEPGKLVHVPIFLAALEDGGARGGEGFSISRAGDAPVSKILVVVPTKDRVDDLRAMVNSLRGMARDPLNMKIRIVDNGSKHKETLQYLEDGKNSGLFEVLNCAEPFNWSRLNNIAAFGNEPIILFVNNDMIVETAGWDDRLRQDLAYRPIGVVGAKLTYPDGKLQHGGILLGGNGERPYHEGVGASVHAWSSHPRWDRLRIAAAVTGAFMGMRREVFEAAGRFNEALPVAYNDVDMCLRARSAGFHVLYDPSLHLIHGESLTRGTIMTPEHQRIDEEHFKILKAEWPADYDLDPSVNPNWAPTPRRPFRYLVHPSRDRILAWIDAARSEPWRSRRRETAAQI